MKMRLAPLSQLNLDETAYVLEPWIPGDEGADATDGSIQGPTVVEPFTPGDEGADATDVSIQPATVVGTFIPGDE